MESTPRGGRRVLYDGLNFNPAVETAVSPTCGRETRQGYRGIIAFQKGLNLFNNTLVGFGNAYYLSIVNKFKYFIEGRIFGVCSFLGEKLGISPGIIRLYFIYTTFISITSPIIIYLVLAFWINLKKYLVRKKSPVWE